MSTGIAPSLFFLNLPDVERLVCVTLSLWEKEEEPRSKQLKTCRELVLLYSDILASPVVDSFTDITVVMATPLFQNGFLQAFAQRLHLQLGSPQRVFPGVLQCCVSYSLITRLSPRWNKAGQYLICGKDFLTEKGKLKAVGVELSSREGQLCVSIEANTVRIPPTNLEDFDLPPLVLRRFSSDPESILDPSSTGGALWCHVLPSMKKGQIVTISRHLPKNGPFKSYRDLQNHWNQMYGYRLPELPEAEVVYCSVYFRLVGERLFTYPLSCIRLQPLQRCPRVDLQGALDSFLCDFRGRVQSLCGFPVHLSGKPRYCTSGLNTATSVQLLNSQQINLTSTSTTRPGLHLPRLPRALPQHPPSFRPQPVREQPSARVCFSQQDGAQGLLGNFTNLTQSHRHRKVKDQYSFSSSQDFISFSESATLDSASFCISSSSPYSTSSLPRSQPGASLTSSSINSSSSSLPLFQPASFLTSSPSCNTSSSSSSSVFLSQPVLPLTSSVSPFSSSPSFSMSSLPVSRPVSSHVFPSTSVLLPPPPPPFNTSSTAIPIFTTKQPSQRINIALLRAQKQNEQQRGRGGGGGGQERTRITFPTIRKHTPTSGPSSTAASALLSSPSVLPRQPLPPPFVPRFNRCLKVSSRSKSSSSATLPPPPPPILHPTDAVPSLKHTISLHPTGISKSSRVIAPVLETNQKMLESCSITTVKKKEKNVCGSSRKQTTAATTPRPLPLNLTESDVPNKGRPTTCSGVTKSRGKVRKVDVEQMARSNQLSKVNSSILLVWLKQRGVLVSTKHRKEELILKVMGCLAES